MAKRLWLAGLVLFVVIGVTDFVQTYALITGGEGAVYEANPVADAWLERYGWSGLAVFKLGVIAVFTGAVTLLAIRRPWVGGGVMALGCVAHLAVILYSGQLLAQSDNLYAKVATEGVVERRVPPSPTIPDPIDP